MKIDESSHLFSLYITLDWIHDFDRFDNAMNNKISLQSPKNDVKKPRITSIFKKKTAISTN